MESDEQLMVRVQDGDERALEALIERWRAPLYGFLHRRSEPAAVDDLFQESWIRVTRASRRFDPTRRFSTWLFQIANNLCRDRARRRAVEARYREARRLDPPRTTAPAPVDARLDVARCLDALPDRLREVVVLRYFHDLGEREIAEIVGIPRGTVKSRLHHAVRALRESVERNQETGGEDG